MPKSLLLPPSERIPSRLRHPGRIRRSHRAIRQREAAVRIEGLPAADLVSPDRQVGGHLDVPVTALKSCWRHQNQLSVRVALDPERLVLHAKIEKLIVRQRALESQTSRQNSVGERNMHSESLLRPESKRRHDIYCREESRERYPKRMLLVAAVRRA